MYRLRCPACDCIYKASSRYRQCPSCSNDSLVPLILSAAVGGVTDSALIGTAVGLATGGSLIDSALGATVGDILSGGGLFD